MGNTSDYLSNPKLMREKQVHSDLFSTIQGHGTREKGEKGMILSFFLHLIKTLYKNLITKSLGATKKLRIIAKWLILKYTYFFILLL